MTDPKLEDFKAIFDAHYSYLVNLSNKMIDDSNAAEDIVQEVFIKIWNNREKIDIYHSIKSYLSKSVVNASLDYIKSIRTTIKLDNKDFQELAKSEITENELAFREVYELLDNAIKRLPPKCRVIFSLSRFQGMTSQQIADSLGVSKKTVDNQIGIALKKLRAELSETNTEYQLVLQCSLILILLLI